MVVHFTVVGDNDLSILVRQRLGSGSDIHDAQSYMGKTDPLADVEPVTIWPAMLDRGSHARE